MSPWETWGEPAAHSTPCFARSPPLPGTAGAGLFHWGSARAGGSSTAGAQRRRKKDNRLLPQFHCSIKQEQPVKHAIRTHARRQHFSTNPLTLTLLSSIYVSIQRQAESLHPNCSDLRAGGRNSFSFYSPRQLKT